MDDMPKIVLTARLDRTASLDVLKTDLKEIEKQLPAINLSVNVDGNAIKNQLPQIQTQINSATQTVVKNVKPVSLDNIFTFSRNNMSQLYSQLDEYKKKLSELSNFSNVKYSVNTTGTGQIDTAKFTYYNDALKQTVTETYKVDTASQEAANSINRMVLSGTTYSTNVSKYINDNQKLSNSIAEITSKWNLLQTQTNKSGISLSNENVGGLTNSLSTGDIQQAQHYMSLLRTEYQQLNATMQKGLPENAIENLNTKIINMSTGITTLENKFKSLGNSKFIPENLTSEISSIRNQLTSINTIDNPEDKVKAYNTLTQSVQKLNNAYKTAAQSTKLLNQDNNLAIDKVKLTNSIEAWATKNSKALKMVGVSLDEIKSKVNTADRATLTGLTKEFNSVKKEAETAGKTGRSFVDEIKNDLGKVSQWLGASTIIFGALSQVKEGIQTINDLNTSMTNIQMITGMSASQVGDLTKQYSDLASQLHETTTSIMTASEEFLRAGNSAEDTASLLKASTVMSKIAGQSQQESAQSLISIMNAYHMSASEMMGVTDKLVAVDNVSATSTAELSEAIQKVASSASEAGVTLPQLISYIGTISSVTRNSAETVGTSINSMISRFASIKEGKNFDPDNNPLNNVEKSLNRYGIAMRANSTTFKSFSSVIEETSSKWSSFNDIQKNDIATQIAGTRQRNQFLVLMQNMNTALSLQSTETDSAGNAMSRYNVYTTSTKAKIDDFTNSVQKMWMSIINSSEINGVIDSGTHVVSLISTMTNQFGTLPTLIGAASLALSVFGKNYNLLQTKEVTNDSGISSLKIGTSSSFQKQAQAELATQLKTDVQALQDYSAGWKTANNETEFANSTLGKASKSAQDYADKIKNGTGTADMFAKSQTTVASASEKVGSSSKLASVGVGLLNAAFDAFIVFAVIEVIQKLVSATDDYINRVQKQKEVLDSASQAYTDAQSKVKDLNDQLTATNKQITELESKKALTFVEQSQLTTLQNTSLELAKQLETQKLLEQEKAKTQTNEAVKTLNNYGTQRDRYASGNNAGQEVPWYDIYYKDTAGKGVTNSAKDGEVSEQNTIPKLIQEYQQLSALGTNITDDQKKELASLKTSLATIASEYGNAANKIVADDNSAEGKVKKNALNTRDSILKVVDAANYETSAFNAVTKDTKFAGITTELSNLAKKGKLTADTLDDPKYKDFKISLSNAGVSAKDAVTQINALNKASKYSANSANTATQSYADLAKTLSSLITSNVANYQSISTILDDVKSYGTLSSDNLSSMLKAFPDMSTSVLEYQAGLKSTSQMVELLKNKQKSLSDSYKKEIEEQLASDTNFYSQKMAKQTTLIAELKSQYGIDYKNYTTFEELKNAISNAVDSTIVSNKGQTISDLVAVYAADSKNYSTYEQAKTSIENMVLADIQTLGAGQIVKLANQYDIDGVNFTNAEQNKAKVAGIVSQSIIAMNGAVNTSMKTLLGNEIKSYQDAQKTLKTNTDNPLDPLGTKARQNSQIKSKYGDSFSIQAKTQELQQTLDNLNKTTTTDTLSAQIDKILNGINAKIPQTTSALKSADSAANKAGKSAESATKKAAAALKSEYESELKIIEANKDSNKPDKYGVEGLQYYQQLLALQNKYKNSQLELDTKAELASKVLEAHKSYEQSIYDTSKDELQNRIDLGVIQDNSKEKLQNLLEIQKNLNSSSMSLVNTKENQLEIEKEIYDTEKAMRESDKSNIDSLVSETESMVKQQLDDEKERHQTKLDNTKSEYDAEKTALDNELDVIKDKIKLQEDALQKEKDAQDHNENQAEKEKAVSDLKSKISVASNDTSDAGIKNTLDLQNQLADAQKSLTDFQNDYSYDQQKQALEDAESSYEKQYKAKEDELEKEEKAKEAKLQKEIDAVEKESSNEVNVRKKAMDLINSKSQTFYNDLMNYNATYSDKTTNEMKNLWDSAYDGLDRYGLKQIDVLATLEKLTSKMQSYSSIAQTMATRNTGSIASDNTYTVKKGDTLAGIADYFGITLAKLKSANSNITSVTAGKKVKIPTYSTGTLSADGGLSILDELGLGTELIVHAPTQGRLVNMEKGGVVYDAAKTKNLDSFGLNPQQFIANQLSQMKLSSLSNVTPNNTSFSPHLDMSFVIQGNADNDVVNRLKKSLYPIVYDAINQSFVENGGSSSTLNK